MNGLVLQVHRNFNLPKLRFTMRLSDWVMRIGVRDTEYLHPYGSGDRATSRPRMMNCSEPQSEQRIVRVVSAPTFKYTV